MNIGPLTIEVGALMFDFVCLPFLYKNGMFLLPKPAKYICDPVQNLTAYPPVITDLPIFP